MAEASVAHPHDTLESIVIRARNSLSVPRRSSRRQRSSTHRQTADTRRSPAR